MSPAPAVPLNVLDRMLARGHLRLCQRGGPGILLQFQVWCAGRFDATALQAAVDALVLRWPVLNARLEIKPRLQWRPITDRRLNVEWRTLADASETAVLQAAERLMQEPCDLTAGPAVRLVVLHRPDGDDALILQMAHALTDIQGGQALLKQLFGVTPAPPPVESNEPSQDRLDVIGGGAAFRGYWSALQRLKNSPLRRTQTISLPGLPDPGPSGWTSPGRVRLSWLTAEQTTAIRSAAKSMGEGVNVTLLMAAAGFRAVRPLVTAPLTPLSRFVMPLPFSVRQPEDKLLPYHNLALRTVLSARAGELEPFPDLVQQLAQQFTQQRKPEHHADCYWQLRLGERVLQWKPDLVRRQFGRTLRAGCISELVPAQTAAWGATVERSFASMICLPDSKLSVDLWPVGDRYLICFSYPPDVLEDALAERFLHLWQQELLAAVA
jgi:hypothetical protein